jgi:hypothetical protein
VWLHARKLLWPSDDALGEYIASPDPASAAPPTWLRIVGIAKEVMPAGSEDRPTPFLYLPIEQRSFVLGAAIVARGRANAPDLLKTLPAAIAAAQPDAEVPRARTMKEEIDQTLYPTRLGATVPQRVVPFASGDTFVLHSDGIYETVNASGDEYGLDRLARIVAGWPAAFDTRRASTLGFVAERTFDDIVRVYIDDELGGRVPEPTG